MAKKRRSKRRATKRKSNPARRKRRTRQKTTVVMSNPRRKRRKKRASPARRRRATRRRSNPTVKWSEAFFGALKGAAGGAVMYGIDYGASYIPAGAYAQAGASGGLGLVTAILLGKWMPQAGAGIAGAATFATIARVKLAMDLAEKETPPNGVQQDASGARWIPPGFRQDSGRVFDFSRLDREAGVVRMTPNPHATALRTPALPIAASARIREAGASRYVVVPNDARHYGPNNWTRYVNPPRVIREGGRVMKVINRFSA